jgi:hypothetical protein
MEEWRVTGWNYQYSSRTIWIRVTGVVAAALLKCRSRRSLAGYVKWLFGSESRYCSHILMPPR